VKNEDLGATKYVCFLLDYLDYDENGNDKPLKIHGYRLKESDIYVDQQYFKNTIEFLEVFNELFWVQKIYPESPILKGIEEAVSDNTN